MTSRYQILARLASGGMASVYIGRRQGTKELVALKRPHAFVLDHPELIGALKHEAELARKIQHPNVVQLLDLERSEDGLLLVLEYVEGCTLAQLLPPYRERPSELGDLAIALRIFLDVCAGIHAAHSLCREDGTPLNVVHRDVSPQNVLIRIDGVARITDFGIALFEGRGEHTSAGVIKGKISYLAPECLLKLPVDARADQFALGVIAWELLSGQRLFKDGNDYAIIQRVAAADIPALPSRVDPILRPLAEIVMRALQKDPSARFPTTKAFADTLERAARALDLVATHSEVAAKLQTTCGLALTARREEIRLRLEAETSLPSLPASNATRNLRGPSRPPKRIEERDERVASISTRRWRLRRSHQVLGVLGVLGVIATITLGVDAAMGLQSARAFQTQQGALDTGGPEGTQVVKLAAEVPAAADLPATAELEATLTPPLTETDLRTDLAFAKSIERPLTSPSATAEDEAWEQEGTSPQEGSHVEAKDPAPSGTGSLEAQTEDSPEAIPDTPPSQSEASKPAESQPLEPSVKRVRSKDPHSRPASSSKGKGSRRRQSRARLHEERHEQPSRSSTRSESVGELDPPPNPYGD